MSNPADALKPGDRIAWHDGWIGRDHRGTISAVRGQVGGHAIALEIAVDGTRVPSLLWIARDAKHTTATVSSLTPLATAGPIAIVKIVAPPVGSEEWIVGELIGLAFEALSVPGGQSWRRAA